MQAVSDILATLYVIFLLIAFVTYGIWMSQNAFVDYQPEYIFIVIIGILFSLSIVAFCEMEKIGGLLIPSIIIFLCFAIIVSLTIWKSTKKIDTNGARYRNTALVFGMLSIIPALASYFTSESGKGLISKGKNKFRSQN